MKPINLLKKIKEQASELQTILTVSQIEVGYEDEDEDGNIQFYTESEKTREFNDEIYKLLRRIKEL